MLNKFLLSILIFFSISLPYINGQNSLRLSGEGEHWIVEPEIIDYFQLSQKEFNPDSVIFYKYNQWNDSLDLNFNKEGYLNIFRVLVKNELNKKVEIGLSGNLSSGSIIFYFNSIWLTLKRRT